MDLWKGECHLRGTVRLGPAFGVLSPLGWFIYFLLEASTTRMALSGINDCISGSCT